MPEDRQGKHKCLLLNVCHLGPALPSLSAYKQWLLWKLLDIQFINCASPQRNWRSKTHRYILELCYQGNESGLPESPAWSQGGSVSLNLCSLSVERIGEQMAEKGRRVLSFFFFLSKNTAKNFSGLLSIWIMYFTHLKCSIYSDTTIWHRMN